MQNLPKLVLAPVPLPVLRPMLARIVSGVARRHPELFARLGDNKDKRILIDPVNMPFVLLLQPHPDRPRLKAFRRRQNIPHDARITGTFLTLLEMIDGQTDSDALFFSRDLLIEGDTEAVVALRNALDDMDVTLAEDLVSSSGLLSGPARRSLKFLRKVKSHERQ